MTESLDLEAIEKACAEATEGPWSVIPVPWWAGKGFTIGPGPGKMRGRADWVCEIDAKPSVPGVLDDALFIATARSWVPALVARVKELEAALDAPDDCFEHAGNCCAEWCQGCKDGKNGAELRAAAIRARGR